MLSIQPYIYDRNITDLVKQGSAMIHNNMHTIKYNKQNTVQQ